MSKNQNTMQTQTIETTLTQDSKPLGTLYSLKGTNTLNENYHYTLEFISKTKLNNQDHLNKKLTLTLNDTAPKREKTIQGYVSKLTQVQELKKGHYLYKAEIHSLLHYAKKQTKSIIFEKMTTKAILEKILKEYADTFESSITFEVDEEKLIERPYTTQYQQSDYDFIMMILAQEGWYLQNSELDASIQIKDKSVTVSVAPALKLNYTKKRDFKASHVTLGFYDTDKPNIDYTQSSETTHQHAQHSSLSLKIRDAVQKNTVKDHLYEPYAQELKKEVKILTENAQAQSETYEARSQSFELLAGGHIALSHSLDNTKAETELFIFSLEIKAYFPEVVKLFNIEKTDDDSQNEVNYLLTFQAQDNTHHFHAKAQKKIRSNNYLTAIVAKGDDSLATKEGKIKVHFHYDKDKTNSCYLKQTNFQAGASFGSNFSPRVGSEVLVGFVNANINHPVIVGSVHNANNKAPYISPTQTYLKTKTMTDDKEKPNYNEILFEDKRGEEFVKFTASKDYELNIANDATSLVTQDSNTIISKNKSTKIQQSQTLKIAKNQKSIIEKDAVNQSSQKDSAGGLLVTTVEDVYESYTKEDYNQVSHAQTVEVIEGNFTQRILLDSQVSSELLSEKEFNGNLFQSIDSNLEISTTNYEVKAKSINLVSGSDIEFNASSTITLNGGGNIVTIVGSGVHFNGAEVEGTSSESGVEAGEVPVAEIVKPDYHLLRVTEITADIEEQEELGQTIVYTATVERFEADEWGAVEELEEHEEDFLNWYFIKNNDESDDDILQDGITADSIAMNGLEMVVKTQSDNVHSFGHVHCFVSQEIKEGYLRAPLKRDVKIHSIKGRDVAKDDGELKYRVAFNVEEPTAEELELFEAKIVTIDDKGEQKEEVITLDESLEMAYDFKAEDRLLSIKPTVTKTDDMTNSTKIETKVRKLLSEEITNIRADDNNNEYISKQNSNDYILKANAGFLDGKVLKMSLEIFDKDGSSLIVVNKESVVYDTEVKHIFKLKDIAKENNLDRNKFFEYEGTVG